ncbi:MAG: Adaptive-response sensory-kinase SasA [Elusimicrobia bacterium]|nr:Adaptive-response sensory-kinase SasA [Elusimicrobiota bacterium]
MSIRQRLASFMVLMITLLCVIGGLLLVGGPVILSAFRQSIDSMGSLDAIRELKASLSREKSSLNRYLLLDDEREWISFSEASRISRKNALTLKEQLAKSNPEWAIKFFDQFEKTEKQATSVVQQFKKGNKIKAFEEATTIFEDVIEKISVLEKEKAEEAQQMFERSKKLTKSVESMVIIALAIATLLGLVLFRSLYRAVMTPIEVLRRGAMEFGKGHWDHRIDLKSKNELGVLADAFNVMAENVKQLQMQAVHMDRMSAVGQLAGGVAHEINNPLTAVLGQAQILMARLGEKDASYPQIQKIEQAALRCKKIVRGLLDFSRPSQTAFEEIDMHKTVEATLELCEADLKRARINVEHRITRSLPAIEGNNSELQQVLLNLFNNAIQAMPKGGTLTLDSRIHNDNLSLPERRKGAPPRKAQGPWLEILVKDTGVGIAKEHLGRVFEPFFTTKEIGKGTGLGLAVSMGIIQKHGGDMRVESAGSNRGATFFVILPVKNSIKKVA